MMLLPPPKKKDYDATLYQQHTKHELEELNKKQ